MCAVATVLFSCGEDALKPEIDFSSPYVMKDDPSDPIQHRCYEVYKQYGVSVFFTDTITKEYIGEDHFGKPLYKSETLDLNWDFTSNSSKGSKYVFDYLKDAEQKTNAMRFVDIHLSRASKSMRPFTILLTDSIHRIKGTETTDYQYVSNFRVLALAKLRDMTDRQLDSLSLAIISKTVVDKVKLNSSLTARFYAVSDKGGYYGKEWQEIGSTLRYFTEAKWKNAKLAPNVIWNEGAYEASCAKNPFSVFNPNSGWTEEAFNTARTEITAEAGKYGFVCGDCYLDGAMGHLNTPSKDDDIQFFVTKMLDLGAAKFKERYGKSTLVMKKYDILAKYITETLQVEL